MSAPMKPRLSSLALFFALSVSLALSTTACGDTFGDCNKLSGPTDYDLHYDRVEIYKQTDAIIISYVRGSEIPAKVVANFPIEVGVEKDILDDGSLSRTMGNNVQFPDASHSVITFDELGEVGDEARGEFYVTFVSGSTLSGEFCGTVKDLSSSL